MLELQGKYGAAKIFTDNIEQEAISQVINLMNQHFIEGSQVRMMPDVHAGAGCVIGTTMTITDKVVPNLVGVDIGCGMTVSVLSEKEIDFKELDRVIAEFVPSGFSVRVREHRFLKEVPLLDLRYKEANSSRVDFSLGTLGGGNHFIEVNKDEGGQLYLVIHSGSRNLGKVVAEYYQKQAVAGLKNFKGQQVKLVEELKAQGRQQEISAALKDIKGVSFDPALAYCEGQLLDDYLHDIAIVQRYAHFNRLAMADEILSHMGLHEKESFTTIHNYIDLEHRILRKGAVSAQKGEKLIIPLNMRDGSIIAVGKGNETWNYSAPHGAGRLMSRSKAKELVQLKDFEVSMAGIYTTSVGTSTLDESPFAYKPMQEIIDNIQDTVEILSVIKPLYNFKAH